MINQIKQDLIKNKIKARVEINKSDRHYFLSITDEFMDIFRAFERIEDLKEYLYNTLKIKAR